VFIFAGYSKAMTPLDMPYNLPREKLARKGVAALSTAELIQLIIGSGTAQAPVARIARRAAKRLKASRGSPTFAELRQIVGIGPVRAGQLLAVFELASRFPAAVRTKTITSPEEAFEELKDARQSVTAQCAYLLLDGAGRMIMRGQHEISDTRPGGVASRLLHEALSGRAASLVICFAGFDRALELSLGELTILKDIKSLASICGLRLGIVIVANDRAFTRIGALA
jgi:DNA repair protein RadC